MAQMGMGDRSATETSFFYRHPLDYGRRRQAIERRQGLIGQGLCDTTQTERFEPIEQCLCGTYQDNLGPCAMFERGANGRCVYCDHGHDCHLVDEPPVRADRDCWPTGWWLAPAAFIGAMAWGAFFWWLYGP